MIRDDLPLPETPQIPTILPKGNFRVIFFKLFPLQPERIKNLSFLFSIFFFKIILSLFKYSAVIELELIISEYDPLKTIFPPFLPAPGPISII